MPFSENIFRRWWNWSQKPWWNWTLVKSSQINWSEELEDLAVSDCRAFEGFMQSYSTSFSWFTGIFTSLLFQFEGYQESGTAKSSSSFSVVHSTGSTPDPDISYEISGSGVLLVECTMCKQRPSTSSRSPTRPFPAPSSDGHVLSVSQFGLCGGCSFKEHPPQRPNWDTDKIREGAHS